MSKRKTEYRNYKSRYDRNRDCYRTDETTYVYQEWVAPGMEGNAKGFFRNHVIHVGDEGVTLELMDYLLQTDNAEAQDNEDKDRHEDESVHVEMHEEGSDFNYSRMENISTSRIDGGADNMASGYSGSPEYIGPEPALFGEKPKESPLVQEFNEKVKPSLTEAQTDLFYDRYGMDKPLVQIAQEQPVKENGKNVSHQAISNRLTKLHNKVRKNMPQND